ncbi:GtrA family protein [Mucilaginibacter paludis]|uniref:GtrA/DPMS transmembrane domain-containing protein n=1 Tax=Mucilaginibacter paludis DSM 18603 TaxID=714943 RepID=H1Y192_9SPHI|nr:GtrA family protein [Mucilaginibacter paludis]EHQ30226.1 hypothetical protein Mucpa_6168 [Mucilaginibacter paludis DSM 18603]
MTKRLQESFWKRLLKNQVFRFVLSTGVGFGVDIAAYFCLYNYIFTNASYSIFRISISRYILSLALSFFLGVLVNFLITKFLVFTESKLSPGKQFFRFITVAILGFFANLGVMSWLIRYLNIYPVVARPAAALSLFFASFFVHKFFSFNLSLQNHESGKHSN